MRFSTLTIEMSCLCKNAVCTGPFFFLCVIHNENECERNKNESKNLPDFSTTCRSGDGDGGGVGGSTDCGWT